MKRQSVSPKLRSAILQILSAKFLFGALRRKCVFSTCAEEVVPRLSVRGRHATTGSTAQNLSCQWVSFSCVSQGFKTQLCSQTAEFHDLTSPIEFCPSLSLKKSTTAKDNELPPVPSPTAICWETKHDKEERCAKSRAECPVAAH